MGRPSRRETEMFGAVAGGAVILMLGLGWPSHAVAQGALPQGAQPGVVERPVARPPSDIERERQEIPSLAPKVEEVTNPNQVVATLKKVEFKGNTVLSPSELDAIARKYVDRQVTRGDIAQLKYDVARAYYDEGYILVRVVTPRQDLSAGVLKVDIYEARVGTFNVKNDNVLSERVVKAFSSRVQPGDVFEESDVESMVNDFNDLVNVNAMLNLSQGKQFGTTDMLLNLASAQEDEQRIGVDRYGSKLTGRHNLTLNLQKSNLLKEGEKFNLDAFVSDGVTWSASGAFSIPTGVRNIVFDARYVRTHIEIGDGLSALNATGATRIGEVAFSSNLINMRRQVIRLRGGLQAREHESFLADTINTDDNVRQVFVEGSYLARFTDLLAYGALRVSKGLDALGASSKGAALATRAEGDPEVVLLQPLLYATYRPIPKGEIRATVTGQYATNATLSSDLFILGGQGSVRGFEPAQITGESGVQLSLEYAHTVWKGPWEDANWNVALGPFVDYGRVWNRQDAATTDNRLMSAGLGAQAETDIVNVGKTRLRLDVAFPIGGYRANDVNKAFAYFRLTQAF
jgi:hemolysin activation/secretion protein